MGDYEKRLIEQFKIQEEIIIDLGKVQVLYVLEQKLRKIAKCTFRKDGDKVICRRVRKHR